MKTFLLDTYAMIFINFLMKMYLETSEMVLNFCKFKRDYNISSSHHEQVCVCAYMKLHQAFTEKFHGANVEGPKFH